jgi:dihydrolipoamide dehydrogenase
MKTALVEKNKTLGGTCLNVGCIPSKALLDSSEHFYRAKMQFAAHGILCDQLRVDFAQMLKRKNEVVAETCKGVAYLMKKNKIEVYTGTGVFRDQNHITVQAEKSELPLVGNAVVIATGSCPAALPFAPFDEERIISSTQALSLPGLPQHLLVIGGGAIGLEIGSVYANLGCKVSVVEMLDSLIPMFDRTLGKELQRSLSKTGIQFYLGHKLTALGKSGNIVHLKAQSADGQEVSLDGDYCLVAIGRKPYSDSLNLDAVGVKKDDKGRIMVNERLETTTRGIYAIGDVVTGPMLAHKASEEGIWVAETLAGQKPPLPNYALIPNVVYTWPEVAAVGASEEQLKQKNIAYRSGSFPFKASGRARASMDGEGFIKVLCDAKSDEILGVHMIGPRVADIIAEAVVAMEYRAAAEDIGRISHAHPTLSEVMREAALAATQNRALHM